MRDFHDHACALLASQVREFVAGMVGEADPSRKGDGEALLGMFKSMGEKGFLGIPAPEPYGGGGGGWLETAVVVEEAAALQPSLAAMLTAHYACLTGLLLLASEHQAELFVPPWRGAKWQAGWP